MKLKLCVLATVIGLGSTPAAAQSFVIDSVFDEWGAIPVAATDAAGDESGAFDLTEVKAVTRGMVIYLAWDANASVNLQAGDGSDGTMRIELGFESGDTLTVDLRSRLAYENGNTGSGVPWFDIGYATLPTVALPRYETRVDVANYAAPGETVTLQFSGSDSLNSGAVALVLDQAAQAPPSPSGSDLAADACTDFRIFNLNTLTNGLTDPCQRDGIARMLDAFDAEVICLQEEGGNSAAVVKSRLEEIDPTDNGQPWNVHKEGGDLVASQHTVIGYNTGDRYAAAVVDFGGGEAAFVVSVHTKCCGYAGDSSDNQRIASMQNLAGIIDDLRSGSLSPAMDPYADAPVIVVGDWNHVGSNTPLEIMENPAGPDLTHWIVPGAASNHATTWRDFDGFGFSPGLLDLMAYDAEKLTPCNGFVLETSDLSGAALAALGLQASDSGSSDHRAIVTDFRFGSACPADLNGDGILDNGDINAFIALFLAADPAVDFNGDGILDNGDISGFVGLFLAGC